MMRNPHYIILNLLIIVGCAFLFFSCSYLLAKWFVLTSGLYDKLRPGVPQDVALIFISYVLAALPSALLLGLFPLKKALRLALPAGALAIFFMALQGYFFIFLYTIPGALSIVLVLAVFVAMTATTSQMKLPCTGWRCCRSSCQK